jgi:hypothetical protein
MILALLFSCFLQTTDTATICSASCALQLQAGTNLKITEKPLFNRGIEGSLAKQSCVKIIQDTITKQSINLKQDVTWLGDRKKKEIETTQIGTNKITFYNSTRYEIYAIIAPDNCTCKWELEFDQKMLPFVKNAFKSISFIE